MASRIKYLDRGLAGTLRLLKPRGERRDVQLDLVHGLLPAAGGAGANATSCRSWFLAFPWRLPIAADATETDFDLPRRRPVGGGWAFASGF